MDQQKHKQFAELLVRNQHRVFGYLVSLVIDRAEAEELFQQTCLTLWENWDRYDPALDFFPWACGIAHNHVRNFRRKKQRFPTRLDPDVIELLAEPSQRLHGRAEDRLVALRECLKQLPSRSRQTVESYYRGKTVVQISAESNTTPNAIYKLLDRVRMLLHECVSGKLKAEATS
ncbi:sigma-70 family RNA polymerase sigma factor [Rubinisphaera brasiliensis]|uniref:RNA polymerase, sigma-24 subunit, ECF subfamily n=1 Tax=Rubinisphaera brasiliensis (strain ATCC 49424 / DSM 5305 / JCM 21570 / IAM 15109 / NBRC 103401 / IFAM 1448) TaxID=756272 RepID=F0SS22_RUBBR|nr:sigma-70 family RNA polymerase sigma factor [Rubinisphaera brasiliensis]ADY61360.1 RNA polymerase, sigma-24 subunit, ECF subfamily [Rubinisphaera brasiliensis DSM 5305]